MNLMKRLMLAVALMLVSGGRTYAQDSKHAAMDLGEVLGTEKGCGLKFDQAAITAFIEQRIKPDDMSALATLKLHSSVARTTLSEMSTTEKAAQCTQVRRVAKSYGFIK